MLNSRWDFERDAHQVCLEIANASNESFGRDETKRRIVFNFVPPKIFPSATGLDMHIMVYYGSWMSKVCVFADHVLSQAYKSRK